MKLYKRSDFIQLPANTIYSRVHPAQGEFISGLFCKTSKPGEYGNDWVEQGLIDTNAEHPEEMRDGGEIDEYGEMLRDGFETFRLDYDSAGRDGMFDDADLFVVWDRGDIIKLRDYLNRCLPF